MDEYNIIKPCADLNQLEQEYSNWLRLPHNLRIISNGKCQELHGCDVYTYYLRLKEMILSTKDNAEEEDNNIVFSEGYNFKELENFDMILGISKKIQMSPNIIIIDPTDTAEEIDYKYQRYLRLNSKFRIFSDDYSIQLWGFNVIQMYNTVNSTHDTKESDTEKSNIVRIQESDYDIKNKSVIDPVKNNIIHCSASCDSLAALENCNISIPKNDLRLKSLYMNEVMSIDMSLNVSIPKTVPFFTYDEMVNLGAEFKYKDPTSYYKAVKEAIASGNEKDIINLGWNPSVELNEKNITFARDRQIKWFEENYINVYDLQNISEDISGDFNTKLPIYIVISNPLPPNKDMGNFERFFDRVQYNKIGLSFDLDMVYSFSDFDKDSVTYYYDKLVDFSDYFEIIVNFVDKNTYTELQKTILNHKEDINPNNIFRFIYNSNDKIDRTNEKLVYTAAIDMFLRITAIDIDNSSILHNIDKRFFRIFKGTKEDLDIDRLKEIVKCIYTYQEEPKNIEEDSLELID